MRCPRCTVTLVPDTERMYLTSFEEFAKSQGIRVECRPRKTYKCPNGCFPLLWFDHEGNMYDTDVPIYYRTAFESPAYDHNLKRLQEKIDRCRDDKKKAGLQEKLGKIKARNIAKMERGVCSVCYMYRQCRMKRPGLQECVMFKPSTWKDDIKKET